MERAADERDARLRRLEERVAALEEIAHPPQPRLAIYITDAARRLQWSWGQVEGAEQVRIDIEELLRYLEDKGIAHRLRR